MDNQVKSNLRQKRRLKNTPQRSEKFPNYDATSPTTFIKTELDQILQDPLQTTATHIECQPTSSENLISAIWGAEGTCTSAIAQLHAKIADQDTKINYIVQSIAEINGKFDKLFNYLTQPEHTGPFILSRPPLSPPARTVPLQMQTPTPTTELPVRMLPVSRTSKPELWAQPIYNPPLPAPPTVRRRNNFLKSVANLQELVDLEQLLSNNFQFRQDLIDQMTSVHGSRTNTPGWSIALSIVDSFFDRKFLTTCSWTGSGHGTSKITFKRYHCTIAVFHEIVRFSDDSFTVEETERFFKSVLKNARKRTAAKLLRKSTKKHRKSGPTSMSNGNGTKQNYHDLLDDLSETNLCSLEDSIRIKIE